MLNKNNKIGVLMLLPALILLVILIVYPFVRTVLLSFLSQKIYQSSGKWVGFANYTRMLGSADFWESFGLSIVWTVANVVGQTVFGIITALLLNRKFVGRTLARGLSLLPIFMPAVAMMLMWRWMLNDSYGIINSVLTQLKFTAQPIGWLSTTALAMPTVIFVSIWRYTPFVTMNVLSKMQTIPQELYEAAEIDGASKWQEFWSITLPSIMDVLKIVIVLRVIFMFKKVDEILLLTGGGPGTSTTILPLYTYKNTFESMQMGRGAASAILLMIFIFALMSIYFKLFEKEETE